MKSSYVHPVRRYETYVRLKNGRYFTKACPVCYGSLQSDGVGGWHCNGLIEPEHANQELICCTYAVVAGEVYE